MKVKFFVFGAILWWSIAAISDTSLTFVHTNDIHSHLLPTNNVGQDCKVGEDCLGGIARLQSFIDAERAKNQNVIVLDAGDRFSGTPFYIFHKEKDLIPLFNSLNIDVMTLGNHEFDDETSVLENFLKGVGIPCVLSNAVVPKSPFLEKRISKSFILNKSGVLIGIIGALTPSVNTSAMHGKNVKFIPTVSALRAEIDNLKNQRVNIIVLLSHLGLDEDKKIAEELQDIDIIVGGHSHSLLSNQVSPVEGAYPIVIEHENKTKTLIVSAGANGRYVGKLEAQFDNGGDVISFNGDTVPLSDKIADNKDVQQFITHITTDIQVRLGQKLQTLSQDLLMTEGKNYCVENCAIGEALAEIVLSQIPEADVVLINSGAIRSGWKQGDVLVGDVLQSLPFDGEVVLTDMTGETLKNYMEVGLRNYQVGKRVNALLQTAGANYRFNPNTKKIIELKLRGSDVEPQKIYHVVLPLFIALGGDGFPKIKDYHVLPKTIVDYVQAGLKEKVYIKAPSFNVQKEE